MAIDRNTALLSPIVNKLIWTSADEWRLERKDGLGFLTEPTRKQLVKELRRIADDLEGGDGPKRLLT